MGLYKKLYTKRMLGMKTDHESVMERAQDRSDAEAICALFKKKPETTELKQASLFPDTLDTADSAC